MEEAMSQMPMESAAEEGRQDSWDRRGDGGNLQAEHTQGSMFDDLPMTAGLEAYASPYEQIDTPPYDPLEDFSQESMETDLEDVMEQEATSFEAQEFAENSSEQAPQTAAIELESGAEQAAEHLSAEQPSTEQASITPEAAPPEAAHQSEPVAEPGSEPVTVLTADDFAALEDRILRAVSLVKREREARISAEGQVAALESQKQILETQSRQLETQCQALEAQLREHQAQSPVLERLEREVDSLRVEREQVRQRVERLLGQLDALEL
jgi:hypothetical protein